MLPLRIAGWANLCIGVSHVAGLIWARDFFYWTDVGAEMEQLARIYALAPYALTVIVALFFIGFGLYALSGTTLGSGALLVIRESRAQPCNA